MDRDERLRLDYEQVHAYWRLLKEIRFKLLAIVPTLAGFGISFVGGTGSAEVGIAVGFLGFVATLGVTFYDQRNTQLYDDAMKRAKWLEEQLHLQPHTGDESGLGGIFLSRPRRSRRLFGVALMYHDRGLYLVYSATLGAWAFVIFHSVLRMLNHPNLPLTLVLSFAVGLAFFLGLAAHDQDVDAAYEKERNR